MPTFEDLGRAKFSGIRYEPGFVVFASLARSLSPDFTLFQFFHAIVVNTIIFWFVYKNTKNKFIAITLYYVCLYLNLNTEVLRESLAVCCFLLAWPFFRDGKWICYYLMIILAMTFHISATMLLFFPLCAIPGIRTLFTLGKRNIFICLIIFGICLLIQRRFFSVIQSMSSSDIVSERAEIYAKSSFGGIILNVLGMVEYTIKLIIIPLCALWFLKAKYSIDKTSKENKSFQKMEILIIIGIYLVVVSFVINIFNRYNNYLGLFNFIVISSCFFTKYESEKRQRPLKIPGIYWSLIFLFILLVNSNGYMAGTYGSDTNKRYSLYYPYYSRLNPQIDPKREEIYRYSKHNL